VLSVCKRSLSHFHSLLLPPDIAATARHSEGLLRQSVVTTACVYSRRFAVARGAGALDPPTLACAALLLAAKAEEVPAGTAAVLAAAGTAAAAGGWSPGGRKPEWARELVALAAWPPPPCLDALLDAELELVACLTTCDGGGLAVGHPFADALACAVAAVDGWGRVNGRCGPDESTPPPPSPTARALAARAWAALNDSYLYTDVSLVASPAVLAVAAVVVGASTLKQGRGRGPGGGPPPFTLSPAFLAALPYPGLVLGSVAAAAADMAAGYEAAACLGPDGGADAAGRAVALVRAGRG